jgi:hypothetical protein
MPFGRDRPCERRLFYQRSILIPLLRVKLASKGTGRANQSACREPLFSSKIRLHQGSAAAGCCLAATAGVAPRAQFNEQARQASSDLTGCANPFCCFRMASCFNTPEMGAMNEPD